MPDPIDTARLPLESWRPGVQTRMLASALNGAAQLCVFEQFCDPGTGAPTHYHDVEEILTVRAGQAEVWLNDDRATLTAGQFVIIKAGDKHGFRNTGSTTLHMHAILAEPVFRTYFDDRTETSLRWAPAS